MSLKSKKINILNKYNVNAQQHCHSMPLSHRFVMLVSPVNASLGTNVIELAERKLKVNGVDKEAEWKACICDQLEILSESNSKSPYTQ